MRAEFTAVRAKNWADAIIEIGEACSSALGQLSSAVHEGRLEKKRLMKQAHAVQVEARIVEITKKVADEKLAASDERARLAKEKGRQETREESGASMATFADLVRKGVVSGLHDLGVAAVNVFWTTVLQLTLTIFWAVRTVVLTWNLRK